MKIVRIENKVIETHFITGTLSDFYFLSLHSVDIKYKYGIIFAYPISLQEIRKGQNSVYYCCQLSWNVLALKEIVLPIIINVWKTGIRP